MTVMTKHCMPSAATLSAAAAIIHTGGLVAFPTETVYGLGADALNPAAVARIFAAKQRALSDPLIVHVNDADGVLRVANIAALDAEPERRALFDQLQSAFWPGPLTLVLPRQSDLPALVSAGLESVAVRVPDHPVARALIAACSTPIAAPSANLFGHVSPTTAQHVLADLDGRIDMVIDGGATRIGVESTVLSLMPGNAPAILRPGGVTRAQIEALGIMLAAPRPHTLAADNAQPGPGMLASHYAPRARLELVADLGALRQCVSELAQAGVRVGALLRIEDAAFTTRFTLGEALPDVARMLYAGLRALDEAHVDVIVCARIDGPPGSLAEAIGDRLTRAAYK
jgi:L-threonylcarbamoyladenylate synthase